MGVPGPGTESGGNDRTAAEPLLEAFPTIAAAERQKHEAVLDYWQSICGTRELPPLRDLDPLEISDAAPSSVLLELIGGGEDAEIRHLGETLKGKAELERISEAPRPSILASIARKLSIVAISRNALAFEDEFASDVGATRCWVTLLPLSSAGAWVDYVYAFVTFAPVEADAERSAAEEPATEDEPADASSEIAPCQVDENAARSGRGRARTRRCLGSGRRRRKQRSRSAPSASASESFAFDAGATSGFYATTAVNVKPTLPEIAPAKPQAVAAPVEAADEPAPAVASPEPAPAPTQDRSAVPEQTPQTRNVSSGGNLAEQTYRGQGQGRRSADGQAQGQCRPL